MGKRILVVGGDRRQTYLAERLTALGEVETLAVPDCPDSARDGPCDLLVLPCPTFDGSGNLRAGEGLSVDALQCRVKPETICFGGALDGKRSLLPPALHDAADLLADPEVAAENGRLTAEAAVSLTLRRTEDSLHGKHCLILGWGRIGKPLSRLLRALDGSVTVGARRREVRAEAESLGFCASRLEDLCGPCDLVFNTVSARVLTPEQLRDLGPDCLWIELASAPGGLDPTASALRLLPAGGLPGKLLPRAAAEALYQGLLRYLKEPVVHSRALGAPSCSEVTI